jgi:Zn finger protein HypA/HybF involved in hydrogenase expression
MHDYHAVETVVGRLREANLTGVDEVRIRAGAAYSPVALRQAYEMLTLGTPLQSSRLVVEAAQTECTCPACGTSWDVRCEDVLGGMVVCRSCGTPAEVEGLADIVVVGISP